MAALRAETVRTLALMLRGLTQLWHDDGIAWGELGEERQARWLRFAEFTWGAVERMQRELAPGELAQRGANEHAALEALHVWLHRKHAPFPDSSTAQLFNAAAAYHNDRSLAECNAAEAKAREESAG